MPSLGETFRITATITDIDGNPITAGANTVNLFTPDDTLDQTSVAPTHTGDGIWTQLFTTATTDTEGTWLVVWTNITGAVTAIGKLTLWLADPPV